MNARFFFFNLFAFIAVNSLKIKSIGELPYGVLGTAPKFGLREEIEVAPVSLRPPNNGTKGNKKVVFVQVVKKSAGLAKFVVFHLLITFIAVAVTVVFLVAPRIYRCA